jgi:hypothetical protein
MTGVLQTEFAFMLPFGYEDADGTLHREGVMRLARASDEILPLRDERVRTNEAYLIVILLSRVITRLGTVTHINPKVIEDLYAMDLAFLQQFYNEINRAGAPRVPAACPHCERTFELELNGVGGS